jgi:hypothetical protein
MSVEILRRLQRELRPSGRRPSADRIRPALIARHTPSCLNVIIGKGNTDSFRIASQTSVGSPENVSNRARRCYGFRKGR